MWRCVIYASTLLLAACNAGSEDRVVDKDIAASLDAFANRRIYTSLDPSTLRSIPDAEVEQAIIDFVAHKLGDHYEREVEIVNGLSEGVRATYLTWMVEAEVN